MQHGKPLRTANDIDPHSWGPGGPLIALKVMGLLAGYAIFVWITMTQLERRYLGQPAESATAGADSRGQAVPVPGAVIIHGRSPMTITESGARLATVPPLQGSAKAF